MADDSLILALKGAELGSWDWNIVSGAVSFDENWAGMLGYKVSDLTPGYSTWASLVHPDDLTPAEQNIREHLEGGTPAYEAEFRMRTKQGTWRWILARGKVFERTADGLPLRAVGTHLDVTVRREAQEALKRSEERARKVFENSGTGIVILSNDNRLEECNSAFYELTGLEASRAPALQYEDVVHSEDRPAVQAAIASLRSRKSTTITIEHRLAHRSKKQVWVKNVLSLFGGSSGEGNDSLLALMVDISERKRTEHNALTLLELNRSVAGEQRPEDIAAKTLAILGSRLRITVAQLASYDVLTGMVTVAYEWSEIKRAPLHPYDLTRLLAAPLEAQLRAGDPVFTADVASDARFADAQAFCNEIGLRALMYLPLLQDEHCVAILCLFDESPRTWDETDLALGREALALTWPAIKAAGSKQELVFSEERLRLAKEAAGVGIFDWDLVKQQVKWDERTREIWGAGPSEKITFETFINGVHSEDRAATQAAVERALVPGGSGHYASQYRLLNKRNGSIRYIRALGQTFFRDGKAVRMVGSVDDITRQTIAEQQLRESENRFRVLISAVPDSFYMADAEGRSEYLSPQFLEFTGMTADEMKEHGWLSSIHPDDAERTMTEWIKAIGCGEPFVIQNRVRRHDGVYHWFLGRAVPLRDENGKVIKWYGVHTNIDEQKQLEEKLKLRTEELARSSEEVQSFAYAASHDLQQPLRNISLMSELLLHRQRSALDQDAEELLTRIHSGVQQMSNLVSDLLSYSQVAAYRATQLRSVPCRSAVDAAVDNLRLQIEETQAVIGVGDLPAVLGDELLVSIFQNLIGNALKYRSSVPPQIKIAAEVTGDSCVISVRDNGIGFDIKYADKIFGVFQRLHTIGEYQGSGVGLAICRKVIERYGGRIWAESAPGAGSTFRFSLRLAEAAASA